MAGTGPSAGPVRVTAALCRPGKGQLSSVVSIIQHGVRQMGLPARLCHVGLAMALLLLPATGIARMLPTEPPPISGKATVLDGDTLEIGGSRYRLQGIDAPELDQTCLNGNQIWLCGVTAALELKKILELSEVRCWPIEGSGRGSEAAGPQVVTCLSGDRDIAEMLLVSGAVVSGPGHPPAYFSLEERAKFAKLGIWRGEFVPPAEWREGRRIAGEHAYLNQVCMIKGILLDGRKTYLVPSDENYGTRKIYRSEGETVFCSIGEAEDHGFRRANATRE